MNQIEYEVSKKQMIGLMLIAYAFSFLMRLIWVWHFQDNPNFIWNNELMINTNDGYFFAAGAQQALSNLHMDNPRVFGMWDYGVIFFTTLFTKITPFSLETVILYMPAVISSLVVIPIILIARLYKQTIWGFFAALLGSIAWSYYNRTMTGYYDTDMFSAMAPMFILFFLMKSTIDLNLRSALYAAIAIAVYPFLYDQGQAIVYAIGIIYALYMLLYHGKEDVTYASLILIFLSLIPLTSLGIQQPLNYLFGVILVVIAYLFLNVKELKQQELIGISLILFILFLIFGNVFGLIYGKVMGYVATGTQEEGLHFYSVVQTVREAGKIPFETFANRTSGSQWGVIIALIGYVVLVVRHRAFIMALPLIGIGVFSLWGGLRFTVYAVPIAAMSAVYLFYVMGEQFKDTKVKYLLMLGGTIALLYPNITHILSYNVPTVMNKAEVEDLVKLDSIASDKDYTLAWWDYGYPIWYYSDTSTLIDGGKHNNDNFIVSKIMFSTSQEQVANFSRLAIETYVKDEQQVVANELFNTKENPNKLLNELKKEDYKLPEKTRDIFLYMPYKMMRIFPTVGVFGNLDLKTGRKKRNIMFYPTRVVQQNNTLLSLENGIIIDMSKGEIELGGKKLKIQRFDTANILTAGETQVQSRLMNMDGALCVVYLNSYKQIIVMDRETYNSAYVQMFMLGKYDKELFELVVSSIYSKIYKVKK